MSTTVYNPRKAWLALLGGGVIYFVNAACQYKVPPIMIDLMQALNLTISQGGWLMSIMSLLGLILAIPAGFIIIKLGCKWATVLTAAVTLLGSLIGTFANSFGIMMLSRSLEGVGLGLVSVVSLAVVSTFFPPEKRGVPNGIIMALYTTSFFMMMNVATPITSVFQWQGLWWFCNILSIISVFAAYFFIPNKTDEPIFEDPQGSKSSEKIKFGKLLKSGSLWAVALTFIGFNIGYYGITTYMPTYLVEDVNISQASANLAVSWNAIAGLPGVLIAGYLLDRIGIKNRKLIPAFAMLILAVCYFFAFKVTSVGSATFLLIFVGFICCFVPPSLYTIGPDIIPNTAYASMIIAIVTLGQNLGMTLGPLVVGYTVEASNSWAACSIPIAVLALIGAVLCFMVKTKPSTN